MSRQQDNHQHQSFQQYAFVSQCNDTDQGYCIVAGTAPQGDWVYASRPLPSAQIYQEFNMRANSSNAHDSAYVHQQHIQPFDGITQVTYLAHSGSEGSQVMPTPPLEGYQNRSESVERFGSITGDISRLFDPYQAGQYHHQRPSVDGDVEQTAPTLQQKTHAHNVLNRHPILSWERTSDDNAQTVPDARHTQSGAQTFAQPHPAVHHHEKARSQAGTLQHSWASVAGHHQADCRALQSQSPWLPAKSLDDPTLSNKSLPTVSPNRGGNMQASESNQMKMALKSCYGYVDTQHEVSRLEGVFRPLPKEEKQELALRHMDAHLQDTIQTNVLKDRRDVGSGTSALLSPPKSSHAARAQRATSSADSLQSQRKPRSKSSRGRSRRPYTEQERGRVAYKRKNELVCEDHRRKKTKVNLLRSIILYC